MKKSIKNIITVLGVCLLILPATFSFAQRTQNEKSPPVFVSQKVGKKLVTIEYNAPSVRGRTIGKDLEPMPGKVWRTGADSATVFKVDKKVKIEGKKLAAGRYALFTIAGDKEWTIIFNKTTAQWGAYNYKPEDDVLRVMVNPKKAESFAEQMKFNIDPNGTVSLLWGDNNVEFHVK